jgi:hypothetical protein
MSRHRRIPAQADPWRIDAIRSDTPLRLDVAAAVAYPDGSMTDSDPYQRLGPRARQGTGVT